MAEAREALAGEFGLTAEQLAERLPSGRTPRWNSRVAWASFYLMKAGLIEKPRRGHFAITERGRRVLGPESLFSSEQVTELVGVLERFQIRAGASVYA